MKRKKFLLICEDIIRKRQSPRGQQTYKIGKWRQERMGDFLQELKKEKKGIIRDFLPTADLSFHDVVKGVDFYIVIVDNTYKFLPLSITGERWLEKHKYQHPEIPIICITKEDTTASVKNKIIEAIKTKGS